MMVTRKSVLSDIFLGVKRIQFLPEYSISFTLGSSITCFIEKIHTIEMVLHKNTTKDH